MTKKHLLALGAVACSLTMLASCDKVESKLTDSQANQTILNVDGISANSLKEIYDALVTSGNTNSEKILNNILYIYSQSLYGSFIGKGDEKGLKDVVSTYLSTSQTTDLDAFINDHRALQVKTDGQVNLEASRVRATNIYKDILYRIYTTFLSYVTNSSYQERSLFNEDKFNRYGIDEKSKLKLKPVKTDNDQLQLLMTNKLDEMDKSKSGVIYHNYMLFKELIASFLAESPDNSVMMVHDGIDNLICADIRLDADDDAQEIFERINSTGITLGLPDLIRNYVLMTDEDQDRLYEDYWLITQELLSRDRLESFFMDYLNMKSDNFTKESNAYADFKQMYRDGRYTNETMLQEILHYAKQYHTFYYGDDNLSSDINTALSGLRRLNQTTVFLFLFHVFDDFENGIIDQVELGKILNLLLNYSIRRLVCEIGSNSLRGFYKTLYSRVFNRNQHKDHYYDAIVSFMLQVSSKDAIPSDADFALALKERNLYRKNALCKYLLATIENQGKEKVVTDNLTIEHIMPQNNQVLPLQSEDN